MAAVGSFQQRSNPERFNPPRLTRPLETLGGPNLYGGGNRQKLTGKENENLTSPCIRQYLFAVFEGCHKYNFAVTIVLDSGTVHTTGRFGVRMRHLRGASRRPTKQLPRRLAFRYRHFARFNTRSLSRSFPIALAT